MYGGHDKYGGAVVGGANGGNSGVDLMETLESSSMEETVVVEAEGEDGPREVLLSARLDVSQGGLMWVQNENSTQTYK